MYEEENLHVFEEKSGRTINLNYMCLNPTLVGTQLLLNQSSFHQAGTDDLKRWSISSLARLHPLPVSVRVQSGVEIASLLPLAFVVKMNTLYCVAYRPAPIVQYLFDSVRKIATKPLSQAQIVTTGEVPISYPAKRQLFRTLGDRTDTCRLLHTSLELWLPSIRSELPGI